MNTWNLLKQKCLDIFMFSIFIQLFIELTGESGEASLLSSAPADSLLQHNALHIQHGHDAEGEGQHPLLVPTPTQHERVHGKEPAPSSHRLLGKQQSVRRQRRGEQWRSVAPTGQRQLRR